MLPRYRQHVAGNKQHVARQHVAGSMVSDMVPWSVVDPEVEGKGGKLRDQKG